MADIQALKIKIANSSWVNFVKEQLTDMLPSLPKAVLDFLDQRLSKADFELVKDEVYISVADGAEAVDDLKKGQVEEFSKFLKDATDNEDYNFGIYLIPLVTEIRQQLQSGRIGTDARLANAINNFELSVFDDLPDDEIKDLLNNNILFFFGKLNMVEEMKKRLIAANSTYDPDWSKDYLRNLQTNEEVLGRNRISLDRKIVEPTVANWITDYIISTPGDISKRGAFGEVQYLKMSPNVKTLNVNEQSTLLEVLKLYNWLLSPHATIDEVEAYNAEKYKTAPLLTFRPGPAIIQSDRASNQSIGFGFGVAARPILKKPPVVPVAPQAGTKADMSEINGKVNPGQIDQKLEELKKKVR